MLDKYKTFWEASRALHSKLMKQGISTEVMMKSGKLLRIVRDKTFMFESEAEMAAVMEFALHEYRVNGKTGVETYDEDVGGESEIETEILHALVDSYTSLFEVVTIVMPDHTLLLRDVLGKRGDVWLTDINLSETAAVGFLLFLRVLSFADFNATSGITFAFAGDRKGHLLKKHRKLSDKHPSASDSLKRFIAFFWLHRTDGCAWGPDKRNEAVLSIGPTT